jgi:hypothetical protein
MPRGTRKLAHRHAKGQPWETPMGIVDISRDSAQPVATGNGNRSVDNKLIYLPGDTTTKIYAVDSGTGACATVLGCQPSEFSQIGISSG